MIFSEFSKLFFFFQEFKYILIKFFRKELKMVKGSKQSLFFINLIFMFSICINLK